MRPFNQKPNITVSDKHQIHIFLTLTATRRLVSTETFNDESSPYPKGLDQLINPKVPKKFRWKPLVKRLPLSGCNDIGGLHSCGDDPHCHDGSNDYFFFGFLLRSAKKAQEHR